MLAVTFDAANATGDMSPGGRASSRLPANLEQRIAALEADTGDVRDFDARSWAWLALLGIVIPAVLLVVGWAL